MKTISNTLALAFALAALQAQADINVGKGAISSKQVINEFSPSSAPAAPAVSAVPADDQDDTIEKGEHSRGMLCKTRGLGATCEKTETKNTEASSPNRPAYQAAAHSDACSENGISMEVFFSYNSAELTPAAREQLRPIGDALASEQLKGLSYRIEGHTDAVGGEEYNKNLSLRRADSVKKYLTESFRFTGKTMQTVGKGKNGLADPADPFSEKNRRVRIVRLSCR